MPAGPVSALARQGHPVPGAAGWRDDFRLRQQFPERTIHGVGDAAYHGKVLLVENTTFTTRLPVNAVLYAPAPPRTGKRGRPRLKGQRLGVPAELATTADWRRVTVSRYGHRDTVDAAETAALWYGAFGAQPGRVVLVRDPGSDKILALFTTDRPTASNASWPATRTAGRSRPPSPPASNCSASAKPATACAARSNAPCRSSSSSTASSSSVRAARPPPRRPRRPTPRPALVPAQGRHRLRRHARQTPQNPSRSTNYRRCRGSARPQQIPRLRTGLRRSRRVTAKLKKRTNGMKIGSVILACTYSVVGISQNGAVQKGRNDDADHRPGSGALAGQVVAHPVPHRVGQDSSVAIGDVLERVRPTASCVVAPCGTPAVGVLMSAFGATLYRGGHYLRMLVITEFNL